MSESDDGSLDSFILVNEDTHSLKNEIEISNENTSICNLPNAPINSSNLHGREADDFDFGSILMAKEKESTTISSNNENDNRTEYNEKNIDNNYTCPTTIENGFDSFCKISEHFDESPIEELERVRDPILCEDYKIESIKSQIISDNKVEKMENTKPMNDNSFYVESDINEEDSMIIRDNSLERSFIPNMFNNFESNEIDYDSKLSDVIFSEYKSINDEIETNFGSERENLELKTSCITDKLKVKETDVINNIGDEIKMENIEDVSKLLRNDSIEPVIKNDETDFRVNVLLRHDSQDLWETNKYVEPDNITESIDFAIRDHNRHVLTDESCNRETRGGFDLAEDTELENKFRNLEPSRDQKADFGMDVETDDTDFRVNVLTRDDSNDVWETNQYIKNDNDTEHMDSDKYICDNSVFTNEIENREIENEFNLMREKKTENKFQVSESLRVMEIDTEKIDIDKLGDKNIDESDFRVNVLARNDSKDEWETNQYIHDDNNVSKNIDVCNRPVVNNQKENLKLIGIPELENNFQNEKPLQDKESGIENGVKVDETDFRVNVLMRDDSKDVWETNQYIQNDTDDSENIDICKNPVLTNQSDIRKAKEETADKDSENKSRTLETFREKEANFESEVSVDESDSKVNVFTRYDSEDVWETNQCINNENVEQNEDFTTENFNQTTLTNKIYNRETKEEFNMIKVIESEIDFRILESLQDIKIDSDIDIGSVSKVEERDFRVNVSNRYDLEDVWETNQNIPNDNYAENLYCVTDDFSGPILTDPICNRETNEHNDLIEKAESEHEFFSLKSLPDMKIDDKKNDLHFENVRQVDEKKLMSDSMIEENIKIENLENSSKTNQSIQDNNEIVEESIPEMEVGEKRSIIIEKLKETHVSSKALGIKSPPNFNSLNAIIYMLFHCSPFRTEIINYHYSDQIASINLDARTDINIEDAFFINDLCKLFVNMSSEKGISFKNEVESVQRYFRSQSMFDIYEGFSYILNKINLITKTENKKPIKSKNQADISFNNYKSVNYGFISDLFCGQVSIKIFCNKCQTILKEAFQPINSIKLTIRKIQTTTYLEVCINNYFSEHPYKNDERYKCCNRSNLVIKRQMTHAPEYLFIYTDLNATNADTNHNYIGSYDGLIIETEKGMVLYSIDSVIDKIQKNQSHWVAKCFSDDWWIIDDMKIKKIQAFDIISEHSVGFMLKKQHDDR